MQITDQINNSHIMFEGISRPQSVLMFRESGARYSNSKDEIKDDVIVLERYFSDVQNLFLKNLSDFSTEEIDAKAVKLRALLDELIKVKALISDQSSLKPNSTKQRAVSKGKASQRPSRNQRRRSI